MKDEIRTLKSSGANVCNFLNAVISGNAITYIQDIRC